MKHDSAEAQSFFTQKLRKFEKFIFDGNSWRKMSALFNFQALLTVILLLICTCAYVRSIWPSLLDRNKTGLLGTFWKFARIGERLSPYVGFACLGMAVHTLFLAA